ncbi:tRNA pseudouridine(38-40) synthase TruA [Sedimentibacter hydroxybenzoicus DSM 7310]|uniref:tRNA pseudouridine synthase A n=1 Tax=Sedimentibacter hydroxybenzoicus DSM 7310 TaxID=1123245 RepID=A0A974GWM3_SEDHY|nr:tRNA pseudouridine(38-40) synthase TruA [Sedimentibacter hydroxybenzoicus]NYB74200.1 tRNA pseudouridine(38-40) synthase TruA [Sedimentibacter hydroxybenzoicus DSM 7310]
MVRNIKLKISYDGTQYHGWQTQLNRATVQETIEQAICVVMKQKVNLTGSGRTDSGVHALGQVANFTADTNIPEEKIKIALNSILPNDIRVIDSVDIPIEFNSRFDAHDKTYMYQIYNDNVWSPFYSRYSYFVPVGLEIDKMVEAAKHLVGTHDFKGFMAAGSDVKTSIRTVYETKLIKENQLIKFYINGNGFLYNMVRIIAGTLIDIGKGTKSINCIEEAIINKDRTLLGQTAPAQGLFLMNVNYNDR